MSTKGTMDSKLNEMMGLDGAEVKKNGDKKKKKEDFIPSDSWKGARHGYYFGTSNRGTGYYLDPVQNQNQGNINESNESGNGTNEKSDGRKRKRITIDESKNETRILLTGEQLLKEAEQSLDPRSKVLQLTQRSVQTAFTSLAKITRKNALQRAQYAEDPSQYMESELALHEQIQILSGIATSPSLYNQADLQVFRELLLHDNNDVALTVIHILVEWLDPEQDHPVTTVVPLAKRVIKDHLFEPVIDNLAQLNVDTTEDQQGIEDILGIVENMSELDQLEPLTKRPIPTWIAKKTSLITWLFQQIAKSNHERSAEILSLLFQQPEVHKYCSDLTRIPPYKSILLPDDQSKHNGDERDGEVDAMEILLQAIAPYRKKQPTSESESEYLENLVLILTSSLTFAPKYNVSGFLEAQGMELVIRCVRERVHAGGVGLSLLDIASSKSCHHLVKIGGLKHLFPLFMGRSIPKPALQKSKRGKKEWLTKLETYLISIIYNFTRYLTDEEDCKQRLLVKFIENDCEKIDRLVELLLIYDKKASMAEYKFYRSEVEEGIPESEIEMAALSAKLAGGGDLFHRLGAICAYVGAHSKKSHSHLLDQLRLQQSGISVVKAAVEEFVSVLGDKKQKEQLESYLTHI